MKGPFDNERANVTPLFPHLRKEPEEYSADRPALALWLKAECARRIRRTAYFDNDLLGEAAWDIMLDLARAALMQEKVSITSACIASGVAPTTALRWLRILEGKGLVNRMPDPQDRRRDFVAISDTGMAAMAAYFERHIKPWMGA